MLNRRGIPGVTIKRLWEGSNGAKAILRPSNPAPSGAKKTTTSLAPKNSMWFPAYSMTG